MNRRFGLLFVLTLLVLSVTLTACLGGLPQQPAPVPEKAPVAVATAPVITRTLAVTTTKPLTPTIAARVATTVTAATVVSATVGVTTTTRVTATTSVTTTARVTATTNMTATPASPAKPSVPVTGTMSPKIQDVTWALESYGKPDTQVKVLPETPIVARFGTDGTVAGSAGCNNYNGMYVVSGNELSVGPLASTRMMCTKTVMLQEQDYLHALQAARTYQIAPDGKLKITYGEGSVLTYGAQAAAISQPAGTPITPTVGVTTTLPITATGVIRFDPGATTTQVSGQVKPGGSVNYTLDAKAGQKLTVSINANGPMRVAISDPQSQLIGVAEAKEPWFGVLPVTGEYRLTVQAPMDVAMVSYTLEITLR